MFKISLKIKKCVGNRNLMQQVFSAKVLIQNEGILPFDHDGAFKSKISRTETNTQK